MNPPVVITAVERLDGRRRRIFCDGDPFAVSSRDVLDGLGISTGDTWDPDELSEALLREAFPAARSRALKLISVKDRSAARMLDRLRAEGYPEPAAAEAVAWLCEREFIDDSRVARSVAERYAGRGYGRGRIERELRKAGVGEGLADETMAESAPPDAEPARAQEAARALAPRARDRDHLAATLVRRGFSTSAALSSAREAMPAAEDPGSAPSTEHR